MVEEILVKGIKSVPKTMKKTFGATREKLGYD
jgi:hypothetical protein